MSIVCFNEMTKCYISCLNQNIQISSNGFTLITESISTQCFTQHFSNSDESVSHTVDDCPVPNPYVTDVIAWDIQLINYSFTAMYHRYVKCIPKTDCQLSEWPSDTRHIDASRANSLAITCTNNMCSNVGITCPQISFCKIECGNGPYSACNDMQIYIDGQHNSLYVNVAVESSASNIVIYATGTSYVTIQCASSNCMYFEIFGDFVSNYSIHGISHSVVHANYSSLDLHGVSNSVICADNAIQIYLYCTQYEVCHLLDVYGEYVQKQITIVSNGADAITHLRLYAKSSKYIFISAEGRLSITNSSIFASFASYLDLSCYGGNGDIVCSNLNLYLPANAWHRMSMLLCEGRGCQYIMLFGVSKHTKANVVGCGACHTLDECIDQWIIQCDNNHSMPFILNDANDCNADISYEDTIYPCKYWMTPQPTTDPTHHPTELLPIATDYPLINPIISQMSYVLNNAYYLFIIVSIWCMVYCAVKHAYFKYCKSTHFYHENRPSQFILYYSVLSDIFVFIGMYFCSVKCMLFYYSASEYCAMAYPTGDYGLLCATDAYGLCEDMHSSCRINTEQYDMILIWLVIHFVLTVIELVRIYDFVCRPFPMHRYCSDTQGLWSSHCLCCQLCSSESSRHLIRDHYQNVYWKRYLWIGRHTNDNFIYYSIDCGCRYGLFIGFMIHFAVAYKPNVNANDFYIGMEMVILIVIIVITKISLHTIYFCGNPYNKQTDDDPYLIQDILSHTFGYNVSEIIRSYMPFYYRYHHIPSGHQNQKYLFSFDYDCPQDLLCGVMDVNVVDLDQQCGSHHMISNITRTNCFGRFPMHHGSFPYHDPQRQFGSGLHRVGLRHSDRDVSISSLGRLRQDNDDWIGQYHSIATDHISLL
eukprot:467805_1